ncbi:MAG: substrate-binding periplasmic protein [Campylobacterota bacterium]
MRLLLILTLIFTNIIAKEHRDLRQIIESGYIKVGVYYQDIYPFFMKNKHGELSGHDIDMALDIAEKLGVEVIFNREAKTFNSLVDMVANKQIDVVISELSATLQRAKKAMFTTPYIVLNQGMFFNRMSITKIKSKYKKQWQEKLVNSEIKIATRRGTAYENYVKNTFANAEVITFVQWQDVIDAVINGDVDCAYYDEIEIKKLIQQQPNLALKGKTIIVKDKKDPIAMAVNQNSIQLLNWLNLYLTRKEKITSNLLLEKYKKELP